MQVLVFLFSSLFALANAGIFLQITDFHLDDQYSTNGNVNFYCHGYSRFGALGIFGFELIY